MILIKRKFQELQKNAIKSGVCSVCGKRATRSKTFYQTLNPWNKNEDGTVKDHGDIFHELKMEADEWLKKPIYHAKCERG